MTNTSGVVVHAKLEGIQLCRRRDLLLEPLTGSPHHEPQLAGVLEQDEIDLYCPTFLDHAIQHFGHYSF